MSTELTCWQSCWNFLRCKTCCDDPQARGQHEPLLAEKKHNGAVGSNDKPTSASTSHTPHHRPSVDRTPPLSAQQVAIQVESRQISDKLRRDEEERTSPSTSPDLGRHEGSGSKDALKSSPSIPVPVIVTSGSGFEASGSGGSEETLTPPASSISQPASPMGSPRSCSTTPMQSPSHDTSFESGGHADFRHVVQDHESPKKKEQKTIDDREEHSDSN